jgi:phospholipid/cholesterol/gamma-HCH transport system substrate-binding protein
MAVLARRTGATDTYYTRFDNVNGVRFGTEVLYQGFRVGQVEEIEPAEGEKRFRVRFSVKRDWPVDRNAVVRITQGGSFLSAMVLDIQGGGAEGLLEPGAEIASAEQADVFSVLSEAAVELQELMNEAVRPVLDAVGEGVPELLENATAFSEKLNEAGERMNQILAPENVERVRSVVRNVEAVSADLAALTADLGETRRRLDAAMDTLRQLGEENQDEIQQAVRDLQYTMETVAQRIDTFTFNLEVTSRNMNEFSREIRGNPSLLLRGASPPDDEEGDGVAD